MILITQIEPGNKVYPVHLLKFTHNGFLCQCMLQIFFGSGPQFGLEIRGGGGETSPPGLSRGSTTDCCLNNAETLERGL